MSMHLTFNTQNVNISVALKALKSYRSGDYREASIALLQVLDLEPQNWDARLMLGASYYRLEQYFAAQNAFRAVCEKATDAAIKNKGREGMMACASRLGGKNNIPAEFGACAAQTTIVAAWLD